MINLKTGELADLWSDETSAEFKSLSYALKQAISKVLNAAIKIGVTCDIDHLDEATLDYLAVELRSMYYDQSADIATKREIIKNTLQWYMNAGTVESVSGIVQSIFGTAEIENWYEYGDDPFYFKVRTGAAMGQDINDRIEKVIKYVKDARSRIRSIDIERSIEDLEYIAVAVSSYYTNQIIKEG